MSEKLKMNSHYSSKVDARKSKQQLVDELRQLRRQIGRFRAVTDTKTREETGKLEDHKEIFSQVVQIAYDAIIAVDTTGRILLFNDGAEQIFGYSSREVIGEPLDILIPKNAEGTHRDNVRDFLQEKGASRRMNSRQGISGMRRDGTIFPAKASISHVGDGDDIILIVYLRDLTQARQMEEVTRQARDELAHINRTKVLGEISASLAHEINQPISAILLNSQVLKRDNNFNRASSEASSEIISDIINDAKRAGSIIKRLSAHMRPGKHFYEMLDVNQIANDAASMMRSEMVIQRVEVELDLLPSPPTVFGDRIQLQQVLLNCLSNALDAMMDCDRSERRLVLRTRVAGPKTVEISVEDNGAGFDQHAYQQLFEPFYTTKDNGMGMGLSISKNIIQSHGGRFWAESDSPSGATFYIVLPAAAADAEAEFGVDEQAPKSLPVAEPADLDTVFVVDDDRSYCSALGRLVRAAGYAVETFSSADEFLRRDSFDGNGCLIVDLHLPEESGLDLQAKLAKRDYAPPIIFVTGSGDTASGVNAMKLGAIDFLTKPIDEQDLLQAINCAIKCDHRGRALHMRRSVADDAVAALTKREREVMNLVVAGLPNKRIAYTLGISEKTVKAHRGRVMRKTKAGSVAGLVRISELVSNTLQTDRNV